MPSVRIVWLSIVLSLAGCATAPSTRLPSAPPLEAQAAVRQRIVKVAEGLLGAPYLPGGEDPTGMDCSGLVQYTYYRAGLRVPRTAAAQFQEGQRLRSARPGDLLFFNTRGGGVSHVGIYVGNRQMVHVSSSSRQVRKVSLDQRYWRERLVGGVTYLPCTAAC